jgi:hypothetical protein
VPKVRPTHVAIANSSPTQIIAVAKSTTDVGDSAGDGRCTVHIVVAVAPLLPPALTFTCTSFSSRNASKLTT